MDDGREMGVVEIVQVTGKAGRKRGKMASTFSLRPSTGAIGATPRS